VIELLDRHGLGPASLQLEITESSVMDQPARALDVLNALALLGLELAIDDFGTGSPPWRTCSACRSGN
jgi:EAL domain-containing protein (putative c-di-GMP-specific phosphodiesterase class I)